MTVRIILSSQKDSKRGLPSKPLWSGLVHVVPRVGDRVDWPDSPELFEVVDVVHGLGFGVVHVYIPTDRKDELTEWEGE